MDLKKRAVYKIQSRNLLFGVFDGERGFIGIRLKFDHKFLFREYLADGEAFGTVRVLEETPLGFIPDKVPLEESLGTVCENCGKRAWWTGPPAPAPWKCESNCKDVIGCSVSNKELFNLLKEIENNEK